MNGTYSDEDKELRRDWEGIKQLCMYQPVVCGIGPGGHHGKDGNGQAEL